jgi:hypothetical protein
VLAGTERVMAAKWTIRKSQVATMMLVMLATAASSLLPNYVIGAAYELVRGGGQRRGHRRRDRATSQYF